jgi:hemoglobin
MRRKYRRGRRCMIVWVSAAGFKYVVTELLCQAAGGPQRYSGRSMGDSHRHLNDHRRRMAGLHGRPAADAGQVRGAATGADEIKVIVESTREAIVIAPLQEGPPT